MKILFICGSLEPGKDGVGDYTRRLAGELIRQGSDVMIMSINDKFLQTNSQGYQLDNDTRIDVLRLSALEKWQVRLQLARQKANLYQPHWISLQYVPFAFQKKGLPFGLSKKLINICSHCSWHIMFHELWVGMAVQASQKQILWGKLQSFLISNLIHTLQPKVVHTQSQLYVAQLRRLGFPCQRLPLFSNIPFDSSPVIPCSRIKSIQFVVFGTIHPETCLKDFIKELKRYEAEKEVRIKIVSIGRSGKEVQNWIYDFASAGLDFEVLGEQPAEIVSRCLQEASLGVSTCASIVIEKSGTVAAMLEHNLPVLCIAKSWVPRGVQTIKQDGIFELFDGCLDSCLQQNKTINHHSGLKSAVKKFLQALSDPSFA